jgi:hypothetical protein
MFSPANKSSLMTHSHFIRRATPHLAHQYGRRSLTGHTREVPDQ